MATVRRLSSLAARKMRMAISLRLAASSLRIGFAFFISEAVIASREILHCFMVATRLACGVSLARSNKLDRSAKARLLGIPVTVEEQGRPMRRVKTEQRPGRLSPILVAATEFALLPRLWRCALSRTARRAPRRIAEVPLSLPR